MLLNNLYTIQSFTEHDNHLLVIASLMADHAIFSGHFPGHPVLPGVCMMEMVTEITGEWLKKSFRISGSPLIKFLRMIDPVRNPVIYFEIKYESVFGSVITQGRIFSALEIFMKFQLNLVMERVA